jgi:alkylation response protein AidB-like acyl-CoA dehydrogenase
MSLFRAEHDAFRRRIRSFVEARLSPHADEWERRQEFPRELFPELAAEGFLGLSRSQQYGGQGLDFAYDVIFAEELPRSRMGGLTLSILAQTNFFLPLLESLGSESQKAEFLAPAIRGEKIGALASTEPTGGSDITGATHCAAVEDGDFWLVTGEKKFITNGPIADFVLVLAKTRPQHGTSSFSLILVPTDTPGFAVKETLRKLGLHTSPTGWLTFDHCRVPKTHTLGKPHLGYFYHTNNLLEERLIRHKISEMAADLEMGRRFVHSVCESFRDGKVEAKEICMIKFHVVEIVQRVIERCIQLHGGSGFLEENWVSRAYRDARVLSLGGGSSEVMKDLVAGYLRF